MDKSTKQRSRILPVLIASVTASLDAFIWGFCLGYTSPIEEEVKRIGILDDNTFPVFSSCLFFVATLGAAFVSLVTDSIGRKSLIVFFSLPNAIGWLMVASGYHWVLMVVGRCFTGFSVGATTCLTSVYIADLAPKEYRGFYGSMYPHAFVAGIIASYLFGIFLTFRGLALVAVCILLLQDLILAWQPYSPSWLLSRKLEKRAFKTLEYLRGPKYDVKSEIEELKLVIKEGNKWTFLQRAKSLFCGKTNLRILFIVCFLMYGVSATGIFVVSSYSSSILESSSLIPANVASLLPTIFQSLSLFICTLLVDRIGRKPLLIFSGLGIAFSHVILSFYSFGTQLIWYQCSQGEATNFTVSGEHALSQQFCNYITLLPLLAFFLFRFMYGIGWTAISFIWFGELIPSKVRAITASLAICLVELSSAFSLLVFPYLVDFIGDKYVFLIFALVNILNCVFILFFIPETRNMSFNEIQECFKSRIIFFRCKVCCSWYGKDVYQVKLDD